MIIKLAEVFPIRRNPAKMQFVRVVMHAKFVHLHLRLIMKANSKGVSK